ncbi:MAG: penicillin acylase family protein [Acidobacteria bacterium]|nr:penicillin acylase family protein [Acidobacteriota bacterium]
MLIHRILRVVNILIGVLIAAAVAATWWYVWRPLPEVSGTLGAPVSGPATIARDALGVAHIRAASAEDAIFLQGYVTAQDRLWQMDGLRRLAGGELAEVVGPRALESDLEARRLRLKRLAERQAAAAPAGDRRWLAAYARGVNFFLETHRNRLPVEFALLRYDPRPWTMADTVLVGLQMFRTLSQTWRLENQKAALLAGGDKNKVEFLFPPRDGGEAHPGSNAWALAGARTASGKPLLAGDPHLEFSLPSTWYLVHLRAPGLNVSGATLPGAPAVIIGHNQRIAWSVTNLHFDTQDLYLERFDPNSGRYLFRGQAEQAAPERELVQVRGAKPVEHQAWVTRHGPIFLNEAGRFLALKWVAAESGGFSFPMVDLNRASNWIEFRAALARDPGPAGNFVYADVDGNIGYQAAGRLPIRRKWRGDVPVDGASGENEWDGFIPFEELPSYLNPPSGMVVTANENPFPAAYAYEVGGNFSPTFRSRRIRSLLEARKGWRAAEMLGVQTDIYSEFSHFLARQAVAAVENRKATNPEVTAAAALLRAWDGRMERGKPAPLLATLLFQHVRTALAESASPGKGAAYTYAMATSAIAKLLRERPASWFADYDQMLVRELADAVDEGRRMQGRDLNKWDYGLYNLAAIEHPVGGALPLIGKYFNVGRAPMSGSSTTVKQTTSRLGPSMRMVVDLGDWDRSLQNITVGQSGQFLSSHYKDQWKAYDEGTSFPMQFGKIGAQDVLTVTPRQP